MAKALSTDLRSRVLAAVDGGLSCRRAAEQFGVSASSAIRWTNQRRKQGHFAAKRQGGDQRSDRIEAHAPLIMSMVAAKSDITLVEIQEQLAGHGARFGIGTLWRFFDRHKFTLKKSRRTPPNSNVPMS